MDTSIRIEGNDVYLTFNFEEANYVYPLAYIEGFDDVF